VIPVSRFRLIKGKKGSPWFVFFIVMSGIVALTFSWHFVVEKTQGTEKKLGENQFTLLEVYQFGEEFQLYLDQAGRYSAYHTIHDLSAAAGMQGASECGNFSNYNLWNLKDKDCFPTGEQIKSSFAAQFGITLDRYLQLYILPPSQLGYQLDFIQADPLTIRAIPYNKLDFAISKPDPKNKIHPNIKAITIGEPIDPLTIIEKLNKHEAELASLTPVPGGSP
jgi:hypothetical protein